MTGKFSGIYLLTLPGHPSSTEIRNMSRTKPEDALYRLDTRDHRIYALSLNPSGRLLAMNAWNDDSVAVYDALTIAPLAISDGNQRPKVSGDIRQECSPVLSMSWMSDNTLATGCEDGLIKIYEFDENKLEEQRMQLVEDKRKFSKDYSVIGSCYRSRERYSMEYSVSIPEKIVYSGNNHSLLGLEHDPLTNSLLYVNDRGHFGIFSDNGVNISNSSTSIHSSCTCMKFLKDFRIALVGRNHGFSVFDPRMRDGITFVSI